MLNFSSLCKRKFNFPDFQHNYVKRVPLGIDATLQNRDVGPRWGKLNRWTGPGSSQQDSCGRSVCAESSSFFFSFYEDPPLYGGSELPAMASLAGWQPSAAGTAGRKKKETLSLHVFIPRKLLKDL